MVILVNMATTKERLDWAFKNRGKNPAADEYVKRYKDGLLNPELTNEGMQPVPITKPRFDFSKVNLQDAMKWQETGLQSKPSEFLQKVTDIPSDYAEAGKNILDYGAKQADSIAENYTRRKEGGVSGNEALATKLDVLAGTGKTAINAAAQSLFAFAKSSQTPEQEKQVGTKVKEIVTQMGQGVQNVWPEGSPGRNALHSVLATWDTFKTENPEAASNLETAAAFGTILLDLVGVKLGEPIAKEIAVQTGDAIAEGVRMSMPVIKASVDTVKTGAKALGTTVDAAQEERRVTRLAKQEEKVNDAVGRIIQGKPEDIPQAKKALMELDTEGVSTYKDLNTRTGDSIESLSKAQDAELGQYTEKYTSDTLGKYTKVGDTTVVQNPVKDALDGLENAYKLSGEAPNAERIAQLRNKLETEGLTVQEINKIAKEYGVEYKDRSFDKMGNPKAGYNAESFENTRKGVKDVIRERLPNEKSKALDESMSNMYALKDLTVNMENKVNSLYQRIKNRTLAQKVGGAVADVVDLVSMGTLRGFIQKLLPSNVGLKTANSMDLERELSKNLAQVEKLLAIKDEKKFSEAVGKYMEEMQPGMSTRAVSGLTEPEKDALLGKLHTLKSTDMTMDTPNGASSSGYLDEIDLELVQRLDDLKAKSETAKGLSEREYAELKVLMDEVELNTNQTIVPSFKQGEIPQTIEANAAVKRSDDVSDVVLQDLAKKNNVDFAQLNTTIDKKLAQADTWKTYIDSEATRIVQGIPDAKVATAPIKSKQRILEKTLKEESGNIENIKDIARNTIVPNTSEARTEVLKRMDARKDILRRKDQKPENFMGYEGTIYNIKTPDGQIVETQVVSPEMTFGKNLPEFSKSVLGEELFNEIAKRTGVEPGLGHVYYEQLRTMSIAERESQAGKDIIKQSFDYYNKLR